MTLARSHPSLQTLQARAKGDDATAAASGAVDSTREFAAQALERAAHRMRELRYGVTDTANAAQRRMERAADAASEYIAREPLKAALLAAAAGALLMAAYLTSRRRRHS